MTDRLTLEGAYETLGVPSGSDLEAITKAYRELSKRHHPDMPDGSDERQTEINQAFQLLSASFKQNQLVSAEIGQALKTMERALAAQEEAAKAQERRLVAQQAADQVKQATLGYKKARAGPLRIPKFAALGIAGCAAFFGWLADDSFKTLLFDEAMQGSFKLGALAFAGVAGLLQFLDQAQQSAIDGFVERLNDEEVCATVLASSGISYLEPGQSFTLDQLVEHSTYFRPRKTLAHRRILGPFQILEILPLSRSEKLRLAVLKAVEHGMVEEVGKLPRKYRMVEEYREFVESVRWKSF